MLQIRAINVLDQNRALEQRCARAHTHFRALTIFCFSQWWPPWSTEVFSTDASLYGYGLAASDRSRDEVAEAGRRNERSRYRLGAESAREHALAQIGFVVDYDIGKVGEAGSEDKASIPLMGAERWEEDPGLEEIPPSLLVGSRRRALSCGRWLFEEGFKKEQHATRQVQNVIAQVWKKGCKIQARLGGEM